MKTQKSRFRALILILLAAILLLFPAVALAQEGEDGEGEGDGDEVLDYCNSPVAQYFAEELSFDCEKMAAEGVGLGQIMKAWWLSQTLHGFEDDWQGLLLLKSEGQGWGQMKIASRLANGDPKLIEQFLALRQDGVGWGHIKHAQALADATGMSFDEAIAQFQNGLDWDEIKGELEGPPPWAGGQNKANNGPPPWAAGGKHKDKTQGPPPWAKNGNGNGGGNGNGNGNGN